MKLSKKLTLLLAAMFACIGFGTMAACGGGGSDDSSQFSESSVDESSEESSSTEIPASYVYRINVQNLTGFGFKNVSVSLKDGDTILATDTTNASGFAYFEETEIDTVGNYEVVINQMPNGYDYYEEGKTYQTVALAGTELTIPLMPTEGVLQGNAPGGTIYGLGDKLYDFSLTDSDGETLVLSQILETKKLVVLNFWATWCGPCKVEFPALQNAGAQYADDVEIIAVSVSDNLSAVQSFKQQNGYSFHMAESGAGNLANLFGVSMTVPVTVFIDRYGVVTMMHVGNMTETADWTFRFDFFMDDENGVYLPYIIENNENPGGGEDGGDTPVGDNPKPEDYDIVAPNLSDVSNAVTENQNFHFRWQKDGATPGAENYDKYSFPWYVSEDKEYIYPSNQGIHGSYAILYVDFETTAANQTLVFDYLLGSEDNADYLYVSVDGAIVHQLSGNHTKSWQTCYAYVFEGEDSIGTHELALIFLKDTDTTAYEDVVQIRNLRFGEKSEIENADLDINIFRYAATVENPEGSATRFKNYVSVVYNENDEYYHVGTADGPLLLANIMNVSQWSTTSVWMLAYYDYVFSGGINYRSAIEQFAWAANNNLGQTYGYVPVTKKLQQLLKIVVSIEYPDAIAPNIVCNDKTLNHTNEWLELCVYYDHYGNSAPMGDPTAGITYEGAIPMQVGTNEVNVPFAMKPRGFKYKFVPTISGVYRVYSNATMEEADPECFFITNNGTINTENLAYEHYMDIIYADESTGLTYNNFEFYKYFEAGETYYMLFTTFLDETATYDVIIERVGDTYNYLTNLATGPHSANMTTGVEYLPDAKTVVYSEADGYYHVGDENGSIVYLDLLRATPWLPEQTLEKIANDGLAYTDVAKRALYINGVDYTSTVKKWVASSQRNDGELYGMVAVTKEIHDIMQAFAIKYGGIEDTWQMMCYYYQTLGAANQGE